MEIIDARWTPVVNMLLLECICGRRFEHPANRTWARCTCGRSWNILKLKQFSKMKNLQHRR